MIAIRQIQEVKAGAVTVKLPEDFSAKQVEIIILPVEEFPGGSQNLQALLLAAPTLSDDEFQEYEKNREWMNQWNVNDF
ncbi:hypothetical protein EDS67_06870 [candidate division KSB1 bacterium]|nr:MAG: hypothetical protein EDS67_06870 [candidate division KSB1 bacterium]MBC6946894.1 hypothetical protein [candidate division KSB1 bacterium]MCE7941310.1 hypothetical protein [Chlorobi bacterium CHB1]MDL1878425.1 hypothetical protein [Cytophagia bacterium CHB2]